MDHVGLRWIQLFTHIFSQWYNGRHACLRCQVLQIVGYNPGQTIKWVFVASANQVGVRADAGWLEIRGKKVLFVGVKRHFQQYFSYIVAVSFIGGGPGENH